MFEFITALILLALALLGIALKKTYYAFPARELKRQARRGDRLAAALYRAAAYGASLRLLLWTIIGLAAAGGFVLLARVAPPWLAFIAVATLLWYGFAWMPTARVTGLSSRLVVWLTPAVAWLLNYLNPTLDNLTHFIRRHRPVTVHTGLYERDDLLELLEAQKQQPDSRIAPDELDLVAHALSFGDQLVQGVMVPCRVVKTVAASDVVGPVLMGELHSSGHSRFPVYADAKPDQVVGTLYLRDLIEARRGGKVMNFMQPKVYYVHEDHTLYQVLHAFLQTKHHLFIVVNSFEEYVGIITIEDVIEQVIGRPIIDEFDKYDDMRAVASHQARTEHEEHKPVPETVSEVVE